MNTLRIRIARLTAASVLALGLGALGASPALASYSSWAGSASPDSYDFTADDDASTDGVGRGGGVSAVEQVTDASGLQGVPNSTNDDRGSWNW